MKKTISCLKRSIFPGMAGLFLVFMLSNCGSKESKNESATGDSAPAETSKSADCLNGKWAVMENNVEKSFTFKEDNTGTEVNTPDDIRSFKWQKKDDKTIGITYVNDPSNKEWNLNLNCEAETLSFFGLVFKK